MASHMGAVAIGTVTETLAETYSHTRALSLALVETLEREDFVVQSMPDVSPAKWHLAHVTWFFERFVLLEHQAGYELFDKSFDFLFNSYYYTAGEMHARAERGLLTRPTVGQVLRYRAHVDQAMVELINQRRGDSAIEFLVTLGLNHEQQHQELLLTDLKHVFSVNPVQPAVNPDLPMADSVDGGPMHFVEQRGGIRLIGNDGLKSFCFDNETPRHQVLVQPYALGSRLVTNAEYLEFIRGGGYSRPELWLSDGWGKVQSEGWNRPLYWDEDLESEFTLGGRRDIDVNAPVAHVSYYEADAFCRWAGGRLPTEIEWELAAGTVAVEGNVLDSGWWQPVGGQIAAAPMEPRNDTGRADPHSEKDQGKIEQLFGDVWEWTASAYSPYPGFKPLDGSLGEYNGKFMANQMVARGGSCVTSRDHIRACYRSFFYPDARWQVLGFRLAKDA